MITIGNLIRQRREELGMSQSRLASEAGVSAAQISRLESGERSDPSFETIVRLAAALHWSLDELARPLRDDPGVNSDDWQRAGFDHVDEIVPGRHYEVWGDHRHFRILIMRAIARGSTVKWNSSIDEAIVIGDTPTDYDPLHVWTSPVGIPARNLDETPEMALRDAMRWLAEWGGFNEMGRARRDAKLAEQMQPEMREIADSIDRDLADLELHTWRDDSRVRWSNSRFDVYVSREGMKNLVVMTYFKNEMKHAKPVARLPFSEAGATEAASRIRSTLSERDER